MEIKSFSALFKSLMLFEGNQTFSLAHNFQKLPIKMLRQPFY